MKLFSKTKVENNKSWVESAKKIDVSIDIKDTSIFNKMNMIHLSKNAMKLVKAIQPIIKKI